MEEREGKLISVLLDVANLIKYLGIRWGGGAYKSERFLFWQLIMLMVGC